MSGDEKREKLIKNMSRLFLAPTIAAFLLSLACTTTNAARRVGGSPYDGTWSVAIYTLRGDCGSVRVAAQIVGGRVYSKDQSYQANGAVGANGVIRVSVASGRLSASGSGRLSSNSGSGTTAHIHNDTLTAGRLAEECLWEAQGENLSEAEMIKAAGGNILTFMVSALNRAAEQKTDEEGE
jgi:hypothetical protein